MVSQSTYPNCFLCDVYNVKILRDIAKRVRVFPNLLHFQRRGIAGLVYSRSLELGRLWKMVKESLSTSATVSRDVSTPQPLCNQRFQTLGGACYSRLKHKNKINVYAWNKNKINFLKATICLPGCPVLKRMYLVLQPCIFSEQSLQRLQKRWLAECNVILPCSLWGLAYLPMSSMFPHVMAKVHAFAAHWNKASWSSFKDRYLFLQIS